MSRSKINYHNASIVNINGVRTIITSGNEDIVKLVQELKEDVKELKKQIETLKLGDLHDVDVKDAKDFQVLGFDEANSSWGALSE